MDICLEQAHFFIPEERSPIFPHNLWVSPPNGCVVCREGFIAVLAAASEAAAHV
jgi:hypothetical protein